MPRYVPLLAPLLLLLLAVPLISAWRPTDRTCGGTTICLTSFKWCEPSGARECYFPAHVYPQSDDANSYPALVWEDEYEISWKGVKQDSGTVKVQWILLGEGDAQYAAENQTVMWETELAALNNNIKFTPSSNMFLPTTSPEPLSAITFDEAQGLVTARQTIIRLQQGDSSANIVDTSDTFIVLNKAIVGAIETALGNERRMWKRRLTVACVVGILGTGMVAITATWFWMRWQARRRAMYLPGKKVVD